ncbi:MAG TPA: hypothetical protein VMF06_07485 [Candidatus Limnocylindria bacterium]|jgi:hypothetical protein|nr:hypothetical protein [Candidatus Limnocylindria bacterium]
MKRFRRSAIVACLIVASVILLGYVWSQFFVVPNLAGDFVTTKIAGLDSPDAVVRAEVYTGDTGATTRGFTAVIIVSKNWKGDVWDMSHRVFDVDFCGGVDVRWVERGVLEILCDRDGYRQLMTNYHGNWIYVTKTARAAR